MAAADGVDKFSACATSSATNADTMTFAILSFMPFSFRHFVFCDAMPLKSKQRAFSLHASCIAR